MKEGCFSARRLSMLVFFDRGEKGGLEQDAVFTGEGTAFLDSRRTRFHLIK